MRVQRLVNRHTSKIQSIDEAIAIVEQKSQNYRDQRPNWKNLEFIAGEKSVQIQSEAGHIYDLSKRAVSGLTARLGVPADVIKYFNNEGDAASLDRLAGALNDKRKDETFLARFEMRPDGSRMMRAILSSEYAPVDNIDVLKKFAKESPDEVPMRFSYDGDRMAMYVANKNHVHTLHDTSEVWPAAIIGNSECGTETVRVSSGLFRLVCTNGMIRGKLMDKATRRHIGNVNIRKVWDIIQRGMASAIRLAGVIPAEMDALTRQQIVGTRIEQNSMIAAILSDLPVRVITNTVHMYHDHPCEHNLFGLIDALTRVAQYEQDTEDYDEYAGGLADVAVSDYNDKAAFLRNDDKAYAKFITALSA